MCEKRKVVGAGGAIVPSTWTFSEFSNPLQLLLHIPGSVGSFEGRVRRGKVRCPGSVWHHEWQRFRSKCPLDSRRQEKQLTTKRRSISHWDPYKAEVACVHPQGLWVQRMSRHCQLQGTLWPFPRTSLVHGPQEQMIPFQPLMYINPKQGPRGTDGVDKHQALIRFGRPPELPYFLRLRSTLLTSLVHHLQLMDGKSRSREEHSSTLPHPNQVICSTRGKVGIWIWISLFPARCSSHSMQTNDDSWVIWSGL